MRRWSNMVNANRRAALALLLGVVTVAAACSDGDKTRSPDAPNSIDAGAPGAGAGSSVSGAAASAGSRSIAGSAAGGDFSLPEAGAPPFDACGEARTGAACDDLDPCTQNDTCQDGKCAGTAFVSQPALLGKANAFGRGPLLPTGSSVTTQALSGAAQFVGEQLVFADASSYGSQISLVTSGPQGLSLQSSVASPLRWQTYSPSGWLFSTIPILTLTALGAEQLAVISSGRAELYSVAGAKLERLGVSDAPEALGVAARGEQLFACGRQITSNHFDSAHQLVTDAINTDEIDTCLSLALSRDEQSLFVAAFNGVWRVELTANGFGATTQLSSKPAFSVDTGAGQLAVQRIQGSTTLGDIQLYHEADLASPWFTFPKDAPEGTPLGSALLDHGILVLRHTGSALRRNVAEYYAFEGENVVLRGSFVVSESAANRSLFLDGVRLARHGNRVVLQPLRRVLEVDEASGAITEVSGVEQGYLAAAQRLSDSRTVASSASSATVFDTTDPAAPRAISGGLLPPGIEPLQLTLPDDTHPAAQLGVQRWIPGNGASISLLQAENGKPERAGTVTLEGGPGRLYPFRDKLLLLESVASSKRRVLQYRLDELADGQTLEPEAQQTLAGEPTDLQTVDSLTGELFVVSPRPADGAARLLRYPRSAEGHWGDPLSSTIAGLFPPRALSAVAGRVVLGSAGRLAVVDARDDELSITAELTLSGSEELVSIVQQDGAQLALGLRDTKSQKDALSVRRLSDLREVARYDLPEAPIALTPGAKLNVVTTGNQLVTLAPHCPLTELTSPCPEPGARRCRGTRATEVCSTQTGMWEGSESCVDDCEAGSCVTSQAVSVGHQHACLLLSDGTVRCLGRPDLLGANLPAGSTPTLPQTVLLSNGTTPLAASAVATGAQHSCAITQDRAVACWGQSLYGELGSGLAGAAAAENAARSALDEDALPLQDISQISLGGHTSCALQGGTARCAGWGAEGQLGNGELGVSASRDVFEPVISDASSGAPLTGITAISVGYLHACALLQTGEARCWGNDELGQLGDGAGGSGKRSALPVTVRRSAQGAPLTGVVQLASGYAHSCAALDDGTARCWGEGRNGELGQALSGGATFSDVPVTVQSAQGGPLQGVKQVAVGWQFSCALLDDSSVHCFGSGRQGELADGSAGADHSGLLERALLGAEQEPRTGITSLSAGFHQVCVKTVLSGVECGGSSLSQFRYGADDHVARGVRF
jgi:alpha-tubulin suppressor-like RCC1 family protein